jgi:hypothetical protein
MEKVSNCANKLLFGNVYCTKLTEKRKSRSGDAFLGVIAILGNVVDVCGIPTTTDNNLTAVLVSRANSVLCRRRTLPHCAFPESASGGLGGDQSHMQKGRGDDAAAL